MCFEDVEHEIASLKAEGLILTTAEVQDKIACFRHVHEQRRNIHAITGSPVDHIAGNYSAVSY